MKETQNAASPDLENRNTIMFIGPVGAGKTQMYRTLPGRKFVYLFDPNARDAIQGSDDIDFVEFIPDHTDLDIAVKTLKKDSFDRSGRAEKADPKTYIEWEADWDERYSTGFFNQYDWIGFDSVTALSEIIMDRVQKLNSRLGKHPEQADYTAEMNVVKSIFRAASSITGMFCVVHTEVSKEESTGKILGQLVLTGKNRIRLPAKFAHIFGAKVDRDSKGAVKFLCVVKQDREYPAVRTSLPALREEVEIDVTLDYTKPLAGQGIGAYFKERAMK